VEARALVVPLHARPPYARLRHGASPRGRRLHRPDRGLLPAARGGAEAAPGRMTGTRPLVLLANDDGHAAGGLLALREALAPLADVVVCAPEQNQSATSHSLSLHRILRLRRVAEATFALDGTPADC